MFKTLLLSGLVCLMFGSLNAQEESLEVTTLFAQSLFNIENEEAMRSLELELRQHPNINVVRLDWNTQRAFILTQGIESLTIEDFKSWFGIYSSTVNCVQIGVYGIDAIDKYPFTNCSN